MNYLKNIFSFLAILLFSFQIEAANEFTYLDKFIHPACVRLLAIKLNGDNLVSKVNLGNVELRGCANSNYAYAEARLKENYIYSNMKDDGENTEIGYEVLKNLGSGLYLIKYTEEVHGSMGSSSEIMIVKLEKSKNFTLYDNKIKLHNSDCLTKIATIRDKEILDNEKLMKELLQKIK